MRIADILFSHAVPGAFVVDMTPESAGLSNHAALAAGSGAPAPARHRGSARGSAAWPWCCTASPPLARSPRRSISRGRVSWRRASPRWCSSIASRRSSRTGSSIWLPAATTSWSAPTAPSTGSTASPRSSPAPRARRSSTQRRMASEYRFNKLSLSELERDHARTVRERDDVKQRLAELRASFEELRARHQDLRTENTQLRTESNLLARRGPPAGSRPRRGAQRSRRPARAAQGDAEPAEHDLPGPGAIAQVGGLSRRARHLGGVVELSQAPAADAAALPRDLPRPGRRPRQAARDGPGGRAGSPPVAGRIERRGQERAPARARAAAAVGPRSGGRRGGAAPRRRAGRQRAVPPAGASQLALPARGRAPPSYVLVTADGLEPGAAWAGWGTPGGRDGAAMLRELVSWCRAIHLPVVYWDTVGARRLPGGVRFDAVFTVSERPALNQQPGAELLLPGVEPLVWNPIAVAPVAPKNPIYVGAFDRRGSAGELAALEALLGAAADRGLEILDTNAGLQGPLASAVRFPAGLAGLARRRPPAEAEREAIKSAGLVVCSNASARGDFPSWDLLRALAMGMHVVSTPAELQDDVLRRGDRDGRQRHRGSRRARSAGPAPAARRYLARRLRPRARNLLAARSARPDRRSLRDLAGGGGRAESGGGGPPAQRGPGPRPARFPGRADGRPGRRCGSWSRAGWTARRCSATRSIPARVSWSRADDAPDAGPPGESERHAPSVLERGHARHRGGGRRAHRGGKVRQRPGVGGRGRRAGAPARRSIATGRCPPAAWSRCSARPRRPTSTRGPRRRKSPPRSPPAETAA